MSKLVYRIEGATDRNGVEKELPTEWMEQDYNISRLLVGASAFLSWVGHSDYYGLNTSTVESFEIYNNVVTITTRNTVYYLIPIVKG